MQSILIVAYVIIACACAAGGSTRLLNTSNAPQMKPDGRIVSQGMVFSWTVGEQWLFCDMRSPLQGWIAVGFNTIPGLKGTNLVMGAFQDGAPVISDRYVVAVGDHQSVHRLGGTERAVLVEATQDESGVRLQFKLPLESTDEWHHTFEKDRTYHLLMAYSQDPDFGHHSAMRKHFQITL